jgi:hypothetical protein
MALSWLAATTVAAQGVPFVVISLSIITLQQHAETLVLGWDVRPTGELYADSNCSDASSNFTSIFNGVNLTDWDGDSSLWSVVNGSIVGSTLLLSTPLTTNQVTHLTCNPYYD